MIELRTLGSIDLLAVKRPDAAAVLTQPKRFALLTYLALAAPGFVRRDTLLALFWPDTDQQRGRKVLRQTVYLLRRSLGSETIRSRGAEEMGVNPDALHCDVVLFEAALAEGRWADALTYYRGDFLTGFHVPDAAPELEEWQQRETRRLRALAKQAAWSLATSSESQSNLTGAAHWARRAFSLDPSNDELTAQTMRLLARAHDRAGALRVYQEYEQHMREDLGIDPEPSVQRLAVSLRKDAAPAVAAAISIAPPAPESPPPIVRESPPQPRTGRPLRWAVAAAVLIIAAGAFMLRTVDFGAAEPVIAVEAIRPADGDSVQGLANLSADLLSTSLARLSGVQVIPATRLYDVQSQLRAAGRPVTSTLAAAKHAGAQHLIQGTVNEEDHRVRLDLQIIDARSGVVVKAYRADGNNLYAVVDDATAQIAAGYGVAAPNVGIADATTTSIVAYRLYDEGVRAFYQEDARGAFRLLDAALREDSTFALAAFYASRVALTVAPERSVELQQRAARFASRAPDRERLLILEQVAALQMSSTGSALADTMADRYPLDPNTQYALGHASQRRADFRTAAVQFRRVVDLDSLSLLHGSRCLACDGYMSLIWTYLFLDSAAQAERVAREYQRVRSKEVGPAWMLSLTLARQNRVGEALRVLSAADTLRAGALNIDVAAANLAIRVGNFAEADARLNRLLRAEKLSLRREAAWYEVISLRAQGRLREALQLSNQYAELAVRPTLLLELDSAARAAREWDVPAPGIPEPGHFARHHVWMFTHVATALAAAGDTVRLAVLADSMERLGPRSGYGRDWKLHHYVRGLLWNARHQPARAAESFRSSIWSWSEGYTRANFELAKTLLVLGRPRDALYPLQAALRGDIEASNLYITRTELHEQLARTFDLLGQRDSAIVHYRSVVTAWHAADPIFHERRKAAQNRLNYLLTTSGGRPIVGS